MLSCYPKCQEMVLEYSHVVLFTLCSVDCGPPVAPQNGYLESYTNTAEGAEVFYSCDPGHVPQERMRAVCTENGWTPNPVDLRCTGMLL